VTARAPRPLDAGQLKELYERKARALSRRPELARATGVLRLRLQDGLRCELETGDRGLTADLPVGDGGAGGGPQPADLVRAGLGAALAIGYKIWAARLEIPLGCVHIEIGSDHDARGQLLPDSEVAPGWQRLVVDVLIESDAPREDILRLAELAHRRCPLLTMLSSTVEQILRVQVLPVGTGQPRR
jgi:uncharacterized OsmC-like protein